MDQYVSVLYEIVTRGLTRTYLFSKSPEEDDEASELDEAEEVLGVILPAHKYAALLAANRARPQ